LDKANTFANKFSTNSTLCDTSQLPPQIPAVNTHMSKIYFRTRAVYKILLNLDSNKSAGPDCLPAEVLKKTAASIAKPLRNLFHLSFTSGVFPSSWKIANVSPIPKKGNKSDPSNYRPIAICSILAKVMETIINQKLSKYLETNSIISDRQYGFRPNRSTGDLLTYLTQKLNYMLQRNGEGCVVALDISKAFD